MDSDALIAEVPENDEPEPNLDSMGEEDEDEEDGDALLICF